MLNSLVRRAIVIDGPSLAILLLHAIVAYGLVLVGRVWLFQRSHFGNVR